jgi:hypothetical protein
MDEIKVGNSFKTVLNGDNAWEKVIFIILVMISFIIILRVSISTLTYIFAPKSSPYIIKGLKNARKLSIISQDPNDPKFVPILRSTDQRYGLEYTWTVWLYIDNIERASGSTERKHIFHKGSENMGDRRKPGVEGSCNYKKDCAQVYNKCTADTTADTTADPSTANSCTTKKEACDVAGAICRPIKGKYNCELEDNCIYESPEQGEAVYNFNLDDNVAFPYNGPGMYLDKNENKIIVIMSTQEKLAEEIAIDNIPLNKWINVTIRQRSKTLDIYVNGTIARRHKFESIPIQNYGDVYVNMNGGYEGNISALQYHNRALTGIEIMDIVNKGPDLTTDVENVVAPPYLSLRWFLNRTFS